MSELFDFSIKLRIKLKGDDLMYAFGPGTASLLRGIKQHHSLNQAAKKMGMAYSKAWKSIRATEEQLGFSLIERRGPNGSILTENGEAVLKLFDEMVEAAHRVAGEVYRQSGFEIKE